MAPHLLNQFTAIVNLMMVKETAHCREQSDLEMVATSNAQKFLGKLENFVQEIFEIF